MRRHRTTAHRSLPPGGVGPRTRGVTLIELLCVMAIIAVLAGLLLGPVAKVMRNARAMQWGEVAGTQMHGVITALRKFLGNRTDYPTVTLPDLEALTLFNQAQLSFLHDRRVAFYPFSPSDPGDKVVLAVQIESGFLTSAAAWTATKEQVTKPLP